jgi:photosystem II stability/assembly factor-like uncharacterized protein
VIYIRVDPNDDRKVWLGGGAVYASADSGRTFAEIRVAGVENDVHAIWIDPKNTDHLLIGNDGGAWVTRDGGRAWENFSNIPLGDISPPIIRTSLVQIARPRPVPP